MTRIRVDLPDTFPFATEMVVRVGDLNYGGHLGNDALLTLLQEARLRFLQKHGFSEADAGGVGLIMTDAAIEYRGQAFQGDRLAVSVAVVDPARSGFHLCYRVQRVGDGKEIARARTGLAFFDYARQRPARMPESFRAQVVEPGTGQMKAP